MADVVGWLSDNKTWIFDGIGVLILGGVGTLAYRIFWPQPQNSTTHTQSARPGPGASVVQAGRDINLSVQTPPSLPSGITAGEHAVLDSMPKLVSELQQGLSDPRGEFIREFVVLPNPRVTFDSSKPRLVLYLENFEGENLIGQLDVLEAKGLVEDLSAGEAVSRIYRMTEKFISHIRPPAGYSSE